MQSLHCNAIEECFFPKIHCTQCTQPGNLDCGDCLLPLPLVGPLPIIVLGKGKRQSPQSKFRGRVHWASWKNTLQSQITVMGFQKGTDCVFQLHNNILCTIFFQVIVRNMRWLFWTDAFFDGEKLLKKNTNDLYNDQKIDGAKLSLLMTTVSWHFCMTFLHDISARHSKSNFSINL